jgi:hypothetical protein
MFWKFFRKTDPHTSVLAAAAIDATELERIVYEAIKGFGQRGCISDDVCRVLNPLPYNTITPRYRTLLNKRLIEATGETRKAISGRSQRVMRCVD